MSDVSLKDNAVKLVMIEWVDSARPTSEWLFLSEYTPLSPIKCVSVGFLLHDDTDIKALAPNIGDVNNENTIQASGIIHIPTCSITKISELEEK